MNPRQQPSDVHRIAVVGQGVIGLSSAARLLEAGCSVTVYSCESLAETTSMAAGAYWWPHKIYPAERVADWSRQSWQEYSRLAEDPETGVHFEKHIRICVDPDDSAYVLDMTDHWERIDTQGFDIDCFEAFSLTVPVVDVPVYLPWLYTRVEALGATFRMEEVKSPAQLFPEFDLVVNCSGVNARHFVSDDSVFPIRGQTVRVSRPDGLRESTRLYQQDDQLTLILPRRDDVVLGGTSQPHRWDRSPDDADTDAILQQCRDIVPDLHESDTLGTTVGLRPGRSEVRLELDRNIPNQPVIHNYGHGGGGYTVSWGCAREVAQLVDEYLKSPNTGNRQGSADNQP